VDFGTVVGIFIGMGLVFSAIVMGGGLLLFLDVPSLLIVFGGVAASILMSFPLPVAKTVPGVVMRAFLHKAPSHRVILEAIIKYAQRSRRPCRTPNFPARFRRGVPPPGDALAGGRGN
jgi:chemotaxis protein MotA